MKSSKYLASALVAATVVGTLGLAYAQSATDPAPIANPTVQEAPVQPTTPPAAASTEPTTSSSSSSATTPATMPAADASQDPVLANRADRN